MCSLPNQISGLDVVESGHMKPSKCGGALPLSRKCIAGRVKRSRPRLLSCVSQPAVATQNVRDKQEMKKKKKKLK